MYVIFIVISFIPLRAIDWQPIVDQLATSTNNQIYDIWINSHLYSIRVNQEPIVHYAFDNTSINAVEKSIEITQDGKLVEHFVYHDNVLKNHQRHSMFGKFAYFIVWALVARFGLQLFFSDATISPDAKSWVAGVYGFCAALSLD
jgi:hypothetical protein